MAEDTRPSTPSTQAVELIELTLTSEQPTPILLPEWVISSVFQGETTIRHRYEYLEFGPRTMGITSPFALGRVHRQRTTETKARLIILSDEVVREARRTMAQTSGHRELVARSTDRQLHASLHRLIRGVEAGARSLEMESLANSCAVDIIRQVEAIVRSDERMAAAAPRVERAREMIHDCFAEEFSLTKLASVAGLSTTHFVRAFGRRFGFSPLVYTMAVRLGIARRQLVAGARIADVARRCGFYDQSHLHRWLKRAIGVTPLQLRASVAWTM